MTKEIFTRSKDMSAEYCCTIVRIGEIVPIENSDFLATTELNGRTIVVRKDQVKEGDVMFYASNETQINGGFLYANSLYDDKSLNADTERKGYFNKYGRVRMVKLRGVVSMGYIFSLEELKNFIPVDITEAELEKLVDTDFDEVDGKLFIKAYVPPMPSNGHGSRGEGRRNKKLKKFNRMIDGQFSYHYDTAQLERNMHRIQPTDSLAISVKEHGTSAIFGNIKVKMPKWNGLYKKVFNKLPKWLQFTKEGYDVIYSSRSVIKNSTINENVTDGYYGTDVWGEYYNLLKDYIPRNITIYGEIVGYTGGSQKMIQKGYDYGCKEGQNYLMIYRVKYHDEHCTKEYDVEEVKNFTLELYDEIEKNSGSEVASKIRPINILYHGTLQELYPDIPTETHWHENVLARLKTEEKFGMEKNEPMCKNKVPREGIVVRIDGDPVAEAFKLKCLKFLGKEAEMIDKGEIDDIDMAERYDNVENI